MNSFIQFKKERDLGAIINDSFKFLRENWKSYGLFVIKIIGPLILIGSALIVFAMLSNYALVGDGSDPEVIMINFSSIMSYFLVMMIGSGLVYALIAEVSLYYIKSYIENGGVANFEEVKNNTYKNIWKFIGFGILAILMIVVGYFMCFLPAVYLGVVLTLGFPILVFEERDVTDTISHCFNLIKNEWWNTFGVLIVVGLIVVVLGLIFELPSMIYDMIFEGVGLGVESDEPANILSDPIAVAVTLLSVFGRYIFYSISFIAAAFIYFDLNEQKYRTGMNERIDNLGKY